ncbi:MAG: dimethylarginine dimethylaminohydrolase family protein [Gemmatimonadaceae bacterium]
MQPLSTRQRTRALTRDVPRTIADCQLTHVARAPIDVEVARAQHADYERALEAAGCTVTRLPELADHPDSAFVEDVAIVLDEVAVLTRPGAVSRRGEVAHIAQALTGYRPLRDITGTATLDGGDVLRLARTLWVGLSGRTNSQGAIQLRSLVTPFGYEVRTVSVKSALHLKTAVTQIAERTLLVNTAWVDASLFGAYDTIEVDPSEPFAANAVWVGGWVVHSTAFPRTQARLTRAGIQLLPVDASELGKAEGGVSCCSLLLADS